MSPAKLAWMVLGSAGLLSGWAIQARAQQCSDDAACPRGFTCEVTAVSDCAAPAPACEPGKACAMAPTPTCESREYRSCVPGVCQTDADCASGMVCHEQRQESCAVAPSPPCADGGLCPRPTPPSCETKVERTCLPRYLLPCEQAAQCGEGFTCEAQQQCGCSGGMAGAGAPIPQPQDGGQAEPAPSIPAPAPPADRPAPEADAGAPSMPGPPDCSCTPTADKYCKPIEVVCTSDAECPALWKCTVTGTSGGPTPMQGCAVPEGQDAGICGGGDRAFVPPPETRRCVPPYADVNVGIPSRGEDAPAESPRPGTPGSVNGGPTSSPAPNPVMQPDAGIVPPSSPQAPADDDAATHVTSCSVSNAGAGRHAFPLWAAALSLLAACGFAARRPRR